MRATRLLIVLALALVVVGVSGAETRKPGISWKTLSWGNLNTVFIPDRGNGSPCKRATMACAWVQSPYSADNPTFFAFASSKPGSLGQRIAHVDYERYSLVTAWSDLRPSGFDNIEIRSISRTGARLRWVQRFMPVTPRGPAEPGACITNTVYAYHMVLVPKANLTRPYPTTAVIELYRRPASPVTP